MELVLRYAIFTVVWAVIIYLLNCAVARRWLRIDVKIAAAYAAAVAVIGVFGEIFLDTIYHAVAARPLWWYNLLPIHGGYTSAYAPVVWGLFGFHCYLLHDTLAKKWHITNKYKIALVLSLEALVLEAALTLSAVPVFGTLLYYYTPGDLWHVTSLQNIPFYYICGLVIAITTKRVRRDPSYAILASVFLLVVIVFMTQ